MGHRFPFNLTWFETSILHPILFANEVVYCFVDHYGRIIYVGITRRGGARFEDHHRIEIAKSKYRATKIIYTVEPDAIRRKSLETLIRFIYDPVANKEAEPSPRRAQNAFGRYVSGLMDVSELPQKPRNAYANPMASALGGFLPPKR